MTDLSGQSFGRYHLIEKLGEGGMAVVYKAFDTRLECDVAVKVIRLDNLPRNSEEIALKRFEREAKAVAQLTHPNIVKVTDFGEEKGLPYLVMEYLPGGTIKQFLGKPMPFSEAACLLEPIAHALSYAHSHNIIHRDVKPSNILITEFGQPMLTDFGIAKILDLQDGQTLTSTGVGIGTPEYMAPEQWTGNISPSVDIYSLGVVFYELVTGHKPYTADTPAAVLIKLVSDPLPKPSSYVSNLPEEVERVLFKALARKPEDRYQAISDLDTALKQLLYLIEDHRAPLIENISFASLEMLEQGESTGETCVDPDIEENRNSSDNILTSKAKEQIFQSRNKEKSGPTDTSATRIEDFPGTTSSITSVIPSDPGGLEWAKDKRNCFEVELEEGVLMEFIRIPAGEFLMGSDPKLDPNAYENELPQHKVYLDEYWIGKYPVSRKQFQIFAKMDKSFLFQWVNDTNLVKNREKHAITDIKWKTAVEFCEWLSDYNDLSIALPTEAQWEKAARGTDGRPYPWGSVFDLERIQKSRYNDNFKMLGMSQNEASPYGVQDISGKIWEWISDWYQRDYYQNSPSRNPQGPEEGTQKVIRGGSWYSEMDTYRSASRKAMLPYLEDDDLGFRCVLVK